MHTRRRTCNDIRVEGGVIVRQFPIARAERRIIMAAVQQVANHGVVSTVNTVQIARRIPVWRIAILIGSGARVCGSRWISPSCLATLQSTADRTPDSHVLDRLHSRSASGMIEAAKSPDALMRTGKNLLVQAIGL